MNDILEYAGGDAEFAEWLGHADRLCKNRCEVGILDLRDVLWRDHFDAGEDPTAALDYEIERGLLE